jgi:hypothetical protein
MPPADMEVFRKFDIAMDDALALDPTEARQAETKLRSLVDLLPQREAIAKDDILPWLERTSEMASRRPDIHNLGELYRHVHWHLRRASGIGGSESGAMLNHYEDDESTFQSATQIVQQKLLLAAPTPATRDMTRGVRAEPDIQRTFLAEHGAVSREDLVAKCRGFRPQKAPWHIGTPDDIVSLAQQIIITDYKAPSADVFEKLRQKVSFEYKAQLHHYAIVASSAGIAFHGLALAPFSNRDWQVPLIEVPFEREFARDLARAAGRIWNNHVMTGVVPEPPLVEDLTPDDPAVRHLVYTIISLKEIVASLNTEISTKLGELDAYFRLNTGLETGRAEFVAGDYSRSRAWEPEALLGLAASHGFDAELYKAPGGKVDTEQALGMLTEIHKSLDDRAALSAALRKLRAGGIPKQIVLDDHKLAEDLAEVGVDLAPAMLVQSRFSTSRKRKGLPFQHVSAIKDQAAELAQAMVETHDDGLRDLLGAIADTVEQDPQNADGAEEIPDIEHLLD